MGTGINEIGGIRVGVDVADIAEVSYCLARFGERYECRLYTPAERADATGSPEARAASLAARFAGKEATLKVLGISDADPPRWRDIEICRDATGRPQLCLHAGAARLARAQRLSGWSVSLTHQGGVAAAVVAATVATDPNVGSTLEQL